MSLLLNQPTSLLRRWGLAALLYIGGWLLGYWTLAAWDYPYPNRWLALAGLMLIVALAILGSNLQHNRRTDNGPLLLTLGYGNGMTLARGLLLLLLAGFLFSPRPAAPLIWLPAILFTASRIIDCFDGYVARVTRHDTKLGAILDIEFDGLDLLVAVLLGVQYGVLPVWYLLLAVSRQLFVLGLWLRKWAGKPNRDLPPSDNRRVVAAYQTGFISVMLWPVFAPPLSTLASVLFALPLIYSFGRDWLVVSYVIDPDSPSYQRGRAALKRFLEGWLPLFARGIAVMLTLLILWRELPTFPHWQPYLAQLGLAHPLVRWGLVTLFGVATLCVILGIAGRLAALVLIYLACLDIWATGFLWYENALLFVTASIATHMGSWWFTRWRPEEPILRTHFGKREDPAP
ncbi:MAG: CDP-alcohol phosphatidyltransferase family protein [Caldilineaceae bacterium]|nr:CDP-alcohol phosphatidyltransferase family protein [Caldilineaceae bacterium]